MPGPIFRSRGDARGALSTGAGRTARRRTTTGGRMLTTPRTARYRAAVARLDASATAGRTDLAAIADALGAEFDEHWAAAPLGFVACCHLGAPYEVHSVTLDGQIVEHYARGRALPGPLEAARTLAASDRYLVVEVHTDRMVCVRPDGSTVTVGG